MKKLAALFLFIALFSPTAFAALTRESPTLARVTVYWAHGGGGSDRWTRQHKCSTGARLQEGHCAVDPRKIPYGSQVLLPDGTKLRAVDTGSAVRTRRAARLSGRTTNERNAIVIDRFFETKGQALAWANRNPMFVPVQIARPNSSAPTTTTTTSRVVVNNAAPRASGLTAATQTATTTRPLINYGSTIVHNPLNKLGR